MRISRDENDTRARARVYTQHDVKISINILSASTIVIPTLAFLFVVVVIDDEIVFHFVSFAKFFFVLRRHSFAVPE